jgi:hypothetical protein
MEAQTPSQPQRGPTFEDVWAMFQKTDEQIQEIAKRQQETDEQMRKTDERLDKRIAETDARLDKRFAETDERLDKRKAEIDEQMQNTGEKIAELSKNIGGLNNSLGALIEEVYSAQLWEKFDALGYEFTRGSRGMKFREKNRLLAEVDIFLENGDYAMPVEVKTQLTTGDVDKHLARMVKIREYLDHRNDKRKLVGALAGGIVPDEVRKYAQEKGLYVIVQSGESVTVAEMPLDFKAMEWEAS